MHDKFWLVDARSTRHRHARVGSPTRGAATGGSTSRGATICCFASETTTCSPHAASTLEHDSHSGRRRRSPVGADRDRRTELGAGGRPRSGAVRVEHVCRRGPRSRPATGTPPRPRSAASRPSASSCPAPTRDRANPPSRAAPSPYASARSPQTATRRSRTPPRTSSATRKSGEDPRRSGRPNSARCRLFRSASTRSGPRNHKLVTVDADVTVTDRTSGPAGFELGGGPQLRARPAEPVMTTWPAMSSAGRRQRTTRQDNSVPSARVPGTDASTRSSSWAATGRATKRVAPTPCGYRTTRAADCSFRGARGTEPASTRCLDF